MPNDMSPEELDALIEKIQAKADELGMSYSAIAPLYLPGSDVRIVDDPEEINKVS